MMLAQLAAVGFDDVFVGRGRRGLQDAVRLVELLGAIDA